MEKKESRLYMKKKEKKVSIFNENRLLKETCDHKVDESVAVEVVDEGKLIVRCNLCGKKFSIKEKSEADLQKDANSLRDAIECILLKGDYAGRPSLPIEVRKQLAVLKITLDTLPELYKDYYLDTLETNRFESERFNNGPCELSSEGGLILGNTSNWKKHKKHSDVEELLGKKKKKHDNYNKNKNKNKNDKKKKNKRDNWY